MFFVVVIITINEMFPQIFFLATVAKEKLQILCIYQISKHLTKISYQI